MISKPNMAKIKTYTQAADELEAILAFLESNEEADMDVMEAKVKRASELIAFCRKKLHELDEKLLAEEGKDEED